MHPFRSGDREPQGKHPMKLCVRPGFPDLLEPELQSTPGDRTWVPQQEVGSVTFRRYGDTTDCAGSRGRSLVSGASVRTTKMSASSSTTRGYRPAYALYAWRQPY